MTTTTGVKFTKLGFVCLACNRVARISKDSLDLMIGRFSDPGGVRSILEILADAHEAFDHCVECSTDSPVDGECINVDFLLKLDALMLFKIGRLFRLDKVLLGELTRSLGVIRIDGPHGLAWRNRVVKGIVEQCYDLKLRESDHFDLF